VASGIQIGSANTYRIGNWLFDVTEPVLRRKSEERRLEERAARVLEILCRHRGAVVSKEQLIAAVWQGRTVSPNSVAIVIGNLRRALDDDPRASVHIVTIGKRGYRLTEEQAPGLTEPANSVRRNWIQIAGAALLAPAVALALVTAVRPSAPRSEIVLEPTQNDTGQAGFDALAHALDTVVAHDAVGLRSVRVLAGATAPPSAGVRRIVVRSRLVMWNGAPELAMTAIDLKAGEVIWSSFAAGPQDTLARNAGDRIRTLQGRL
jgi:DNA-binding winged helix-turn-helix (wHTH) protein